jgi:hypothetical protein
VADDGVTITPMTPALPGLQRHDNDDAVSFHREIQ